MQIILSLATIPALLIALSLSAFAEGGSGLWVNLPYDTSMDAWEPDSQDWTLAGEVSTGPDNLSALIVQPGEGVLVSSLQGRVEFRNLTSKQMFGDIEAHIEFLFPKGSNAGVKLQGLYEIQIRDSHGVKNPQANDCGGIYPRAEELPKYHLIDEGYPPLCNAALPAGQWQSLDVVFQAPRFDSKGHKTANAKFISVIMNGQLIHKDIEQRWPTGGAWRLKKEVARGPLYLQGDHGPIAYRNVRVRTISRHGE